MLYFTIGAAILFWGLLWKTLIKWVEGMTEEQKKKEGLAFLLNLIGLIITWVYLAINYL